jgi:hypothetical protein
MAAPLLAGPQKDGLTQQEREVEKDLRDLLNFLGNHATPVQLNVEG